MDEKYTKAIEPLAARLFPITMNNPKVAYPSID